MLSAHSETWLTLSEIPSLTVSPGVVIADVQTLRRGINFNPITSELHLRYF